MTTRRRIRRLLSAYAGWAVFAGWLLAVLAFLLGASAIIAAATSATYFPFHPDVNWDRSIITFAKVAILVSCSSAILSSAAMGLRRRLLASTAIVAGWFVIFVSGVGVFSFVKRGPEQFDRYVDRQHFLIPWQYQVHGPMPESASNEFSVNFCANDLSGNYGRLCNSGRSQQVVVQSKLGNFVGKMDVLNLQRYLAGMQRGPDFAGHEVYMQFYSSPRDTAELTEIFYLKRDEAGEPLHLAICNTKEATCNHYVRTSDYQLVIPFVPLADFENWEQSAHKYEALINSWRVG